jgi:hypothetical protein
VTPQRIRDDRGADLLRVTPTGVGIGFDCNLDGNTSRLVEPKSRQRLGARSRDILDTVSADSRGVVRFCSQPTQLDRYRWYLNRNCLPRSIPMMCSAVTEQRGIPPANRGDESPGQGTTRGMLEMTTV